MTVTALRLMEYLAVIDDIPSGFFAINVDSPTSALPQLIVGVLGNAARLTILWALLRG